MILIEQGQPFRRQFYLVKVDRTPLDLTGGTLTLSYKRYLDDAEVYTPGNGLTILSAAQGYVEFITLANQIPAQVGTYTGAWNFVASDGTVYNHRADTICVLAA